MFLQEEKQPHVLLCKSWGRPISGDICKSCIKEPGCMECPALERGIAQLPSPPFFSLLRVSGVLSLPQSNASLQAESLHCRPRGRGMQTPCARDAPEGDSSGRRDRAGCESELMCTPGVRPPVLYISWAVSATLAEPQASSCPSALPWQDTMLGWHCLAWGECKIP